MDLFTYLQTGSKQSKKRKGKKRKRGKIKWGTKHPNTKFKSYDTKPQSQMDRLLTTMTANLLQSPQDKARQTNLLQDYGSLNMGERLDERLYYAGLARPTKDQILKNDNSLRSITNIRKDRRYLATMRLFCVHKTKFLCLFLYYKV